MKRRLKQPRMVSNSYYKRILVSTCAIIILIAILLVPGIYSVVNHYTVKNIAAFESKKTDKASLQLNDAFTQLTSFSYFLCDTGILSFQGPEGSTGIWRRKFLHDHINVYMLSSQHIYAMKLETSTMNETIGNPVDSSYTIPVGYFENSTLYIPEQVSHPCCIQLIYNSKIPKQSVSIYTNSAHMANVFLDENVYIINQDGIILLSRDLDMQGSKIQSLYPDISVTSTKSTRDFYVNKQEIGNSNLSAITITPKAKYADQFVLGMLISFGIAFAVMSVILICAIRLIASIYRPIRNIADTFKYHLQNVEEGYEDEIAYINASIEHTLEEKQQLIDDKASSILQLKKSQAQAVYSQISPHFIYNTLDTIKWISIEDYGKENRIITSVMLLNNIISEVLQQHNMITTIENEIAITDNYIKLMLIQYDNSFEAIFDIADDVKTAPIIKLSLQPLIENSIMHSFNSSKKGQFIKIQAQKIMSENSSAPVDGDICITVTDNGGGIPPQKLESLLSDLQSDDPIQHHIGLKNVHLRYKLLYGESYGIRAIESSENGTTIQLLLPPQLY